LPNEHLNGLRDHVDNHVRRLAQLREGIRLAEEEAAFQEVVLDLARNDRLFEALGELYNDAELTSTVARDPLGYVRKEDIPLPEGVTLSAVDREGRTPRLVAHVRYGAWAMEVGWDREDGFFASHPTGPAAAMSGWFMSSVEVPSEYE